MKINTEKLYYEVCAIASFSMVFVSLMAIIYIPYYNDLLLLIPFVYFFQIAYFDSKKKLVIKSKEVVVKSFIFGILNPFYFLYCGIMMLGTEMKYVIKKWNTLEK